MAAGGRTGLTYKSCQKVRVCRVERERDRTPPLRISGKTRIRTELLNLLPQAEESAVQNHQRKKTIGTRIPTFSPVNSSTVSPPTPAVKTRCTWERSSPGSCRIAPKTDALTPRPLPPGTQYDLSSPPKDCKFFFKCGAELSFCQPSAPFLHDLECLRQGSTGEQNQDGKFKNSLLFIWTKSTFGLTID